MLVMVLSLGCNSNSKPAVPEKSPPVERRRREDCANAPRDLYPIAIPPSIKNFEEFAGLLPLV
jgi:hypothetical protein